MQTKNDIFSRKFNNKASENNKRAPPIGSTLHLENPYFILKSYSIEIALAGFSLA